jgi:predicted CopG family antitoxin
MKFSIKDDVYEELVRVKGESESFSDIISDVILKLIKTKNFNMEKYFGCLKDSDVLDNRRVFQKIPGFGEDQKMIVLDTSFLIDYFKGKEEVRYIIKNNDVVTTVVYTTKY